MTEHQLTSIFQIITQDLTPEILSRQQ